MEDSSNVAAAAPPPSDSVTLAECLQAVEMLTSMFGFEEDVANEAVNAVGPDVTRCFNYILDQNMGKDKGGAVYPIDNCPHLETHCKIIPSQIPNNPMQIPCCGPTFKKNTAKAGLKGETEMDGSCPLGENWFCLDCGKVYCSRYVNGHGLEHWENTKTEEEEEEEGKTNRDGHCIAISFADLSVWCHQCQSYIRNETVLSPLLKQLEDYKFSNNNNHNNNNNMIDGGGDDQEYTIDEKDYIRPPKKQRSVSSMDTSLHSSASSKYTTSSTATEEGTNASNDTHNDTDDDDDNDDDNDDFDRDAKIRSFPISLSEEEEEEENEQEKEPIEYPFGTLPTTLKDVADFILSDKCKNIIILAGAGMSVVSGIPDFRSANGLYATMDPDSLTATQMERDLIRLDPSIALDNRLFLQNQLPCLEVNRQFLLGTKDQVWKATLAHRFVELLHKKTNKLKRLYTQNIDGLEDQCQDLPRDKIVNVHGSMDQAECGMCYSPADFETFCTNVRVKIKDITGTDPTAPAQSSHIECPICGYYALKPAIVLFKSSLPQRFFELSSTDVESADLLLVMGTSLKVAPANSLIFRVPDTCLRFMVNRDPVGLHLGIQYGSTAERDFFAPGDIDNTMLELMTHLGWLNDLEPLLQDRLPDPSCELLRARLETERSQIRNATVDR